MLTTLKIPIELYNFKKNTDQLYSYTVIFYPTKHKEDLGSRIRICSHSWI